ncbi:MAG TPA: hypothetical protein VFA59_22450 [Vicinamibacterales bacterium]|nr:hypothetical protein [Vicinamibacterales bacterium]
MSDSFLENQVRRIRELTERMSQVSEQRERLEQADRDAKGSGYGPLHDVRDVRVFNAPASERSIAHDTPPRRRRRRR